MYGAFIGDALGSYLELNHNINTELIEKGSIHFIQPWKCPEEELFPFSRLVSSLTTLKWPLICLLPSLPMIPPNNLAHNNNKSSLTLHSNTWNGTNLIHSTLELRPESDWLRLIIFSKPIKSAKDLLKTYLTFTITCKKNSKPYHQKIKTVKAMAH